MDKGRRKKNLKYYRYKRYLELCRFLISHFKVSKQELPNTAVVIFRGLDYGIPLIMDYKGSFKESFSCIKQIQRWLIPRSSIKSGKYIIDGTLPLRIPKAFNGTCNDGDSHWSIQRLGDI